MSVYYNSKTKNKLKSYYRKFNIYIYIYLISSTSFYQITLYPVQPSLENGHDVRNKQTIGTCKTPWKKPQFSLPTEKGDVY